MELERAKSFERLEWNGNVLLTKCLDCDIILVNVEYVAL